VTLAAAVADEVRRRTTDLGLSQRDLAARAGIPATLVHRAWRGERPFELDEVEALAPVLGVSIVWLIDSAMRRAPRSGECSESNSEPRQE
jgi:transcriptional regulator with XRE-family HTH domain